MTAPTAPKAGNSISPPPEMTSATRWRSLVLRRRVAARAATAMVAVAVAAASLSAAAAAADSTVQGGSGPFSDDDGSVHEAGLDALAAGGFLAGTEVRRRAHLPQQAAEALGDGSLARPGSELRRTRVHQRVPIRGCRRRGMVGAPCGALRRSRSHRRLQDRTPALLPRAA